MQSPARQHYIRHAAAAAAAAAAPEAMHPDANVYELHLAQLIEHKRRLKALQSVERKIEVKRQILPEYTPYVQGVLEAGNGVQDDVLMTVMVWYIDVGAMHDALAIASYALSHGLTLPDQYKRDVATLVTEEIADSYLRASADSVAADAWQATMDVLRQVDTLTASRDMPDEVRAKLYKAMGYTLRGHDNAAALDHLQHALQRNPRAGVKKDIERLERDLKNNPEEKKEVPVTTASAKEDGGSGAGGEQNAALTGTPPVS